MPRNKVVRIETAHGQRLAELFDDLAAQARRGELLSAAFMVEPTTGDRARVGVEGRWLNDPAGLLGELAIIKARIAQVAAERQYG